MATDQPTFDIAAALSRQSEALRAATPTLMELRTQVAWPNDLSLAQWLHLYAMTRDFAPDLVLELGRGYGNSTAAFTQAVNDQRHGSVVSVSHDGERAWATRTAPKVASSVGTRWFDRLEIREMDIFALDFDDLLAPTERVIVWWDAHGDELARHLLTRMMAPLKEKDHVICVHDVDDARFDGVVAGYLRPDGLPTYWQGYLTSPFEELVPLYDFLSRNRIAYGTASASLAHLREKSNAEWRRLRETLDAVGGADAVHSGGWMWFSLRDREAATLELPPVTPPLGDEPSRAEVPPIDPQAPRSIRYRMRRLVQLIR